MPMTRPKNLGGFYWTALNGIHPFTGRRMHPFVQQSLYLNLFMVTIGCTKLIAGFWLNREQERSLAFFLDIALSIAGLLLAIQVRNRLLLKLKRWEIARTYDRAELKFVKRGESDANG